MRHVFCMLVVSFLMVGCGSVQETVAERQAALGAQPDKSNFMEAKQIQDIEVWKDNPGKIVILYVNFPPGSDNVLQFQCKGVPTSSTESLEPNVGDPWSTSGYRWRVPIEGADVATSEMAGRDGTYGDPVHFRQCMTVDGQYLDIPAYGLPYLVTSGPLTFPPSTVKRDFEAEARLLQAEQIIKAGGCVNPETLEKIEC